MEKHGCNIDLQALAELKKEYELEAEALDKDLQRLAKEAVGDTPINLNSPEQLSALLYSRKPKDKSQWTEVFNLGIDEERGKPKRPKKFKPDLFGKYINALTNVQYKTKKEKCSSCDGLGKIAKQRKDGTYGNPRFNCRECTGLGVVYVPTKDVAGFKLVPRDSFDLSSHGFKTDADTLEERLPELKADAKEFVEKMVRYNSVSFYISTFIGGIEKFISRDGFIHANFMQHITATGRLSSQRPNLYNQPRGTTFPVKRCFVSRWEQGLLLDVDFSTLEFCVAAELSNDPRAFQDIADRVDVHVRTSDILTKAGQPTNRQNSKSHTFKPLYGGLSGTSAEVTYYKAFLNDFYPRIGEWHRELCDECVSKGYISLPSGREYDFSHISKFASGHVSHSTQIKNYPVQGFATADIVPACVIEVWKEFRRRNLKSVLLLTIYDSILIDMHPDELDIVPKVVYDVLSSSKKIIKDWFDYDMRIDLRFEIKTGKNWFDMKDYVQ